MAPSNDDQQQQRLNPPSGSSKDPSSVEKQQLHDKNHPVHHQPPQRFDDIFAESQTVKAGIIEARMRREARLFEEKFASDLCRQQHESLVMSQSPVPAHDHKELYETKGSGGASSDSPYEEMDHPEPGVEFVPWGEYGPPTRNLQQPSQHSRSDNHSSRTQTDNNLSRTTSQHSRVIRSHHSREDCTESHDHHHHDLGNVVSHPHENQEALPGEVIEALGEADAELGKASNRSENLPNISDNADASLSVDIENMEQAPDSTSRRCQPRRRTVIVAVVLLVVAVVAVVTVVIAFKGNSSKLQSVTTPMDPPVLSCTDLSHIKQPSVVTQCFCVGRITIVADDIAANYRELISNGIIQDILPGFGSTMDSCNPTNQALVWLASATGMPTGRESLRQRYILALLFIVWNGAKWSTDQGWQTSDDECKWTGVICDENGVVNGLDLHNNGLTGQLGVHVPLLTSLTSLQLDQNSLQGSLPPQLSNLSNLNLLVLENNQLTGTLPSAMLALSQLQGLQLGYNQLSGMIPAWLGQMQSLTSLSLTNNTLATGTPGTHNASNGNSSTAPPSAFPTEFGQLTSLQRLELGSTGINGILPLELFNLSSLQILDLSSNSMYGTISTLFGNLALIQQIALEHNAFTGTIPSEFGRCLDLITLRLSYNHLNGTLPKTLGDIRALVELAVNSNAITGTIPPSICNNAGINFCQFNSSLFCVCCYCP